MARCRRLCLAAGAVLVWLALAGCANLTSTPPTVSPAVNPDLTALNERELVLTSLETPAIMEYSGPNGHLKARERITVRRPASLRVEALSPLGVALVVAADGKEIAIFDPSKDTIARGAATAATLARVAQIPLEPEQVARLLLALPPDPAILAAPLRPVSGRDEMTTLSWQRPDGTVDEIAFRGGNLAKTRETTSAGALSYEVDYSDYQDVGALQFPHTIVAHFPATGITLKLNYQDPAIDRAIPDAAFILTPGPQTRELQFGSSAAASSTTG